MSTLNVTRAGAYVEESGATVAVTRAGAYVQQLLPRINVTRGGAYVQQLLIPEGNMQITDGTTTYDLLTGVLKLRYQGWDQQSPLPEGEMTMQGYAASFKFTGYQPITETYALYAASAATNLVIRQAIATIDTLLEQARRWHSQRNTHMNPVYLSFNTATETERRSLVYGGNIVMQSGNGAQPSLSNNNALATLTITRHPLWVDTSAVSLLTSGITANGGLTATLTQSGTAPGLISRLTLMPSGNNPNALTKVWVGIIPVTEIDRATFDPRFPLTSGTILTTPANPMAVSVGDGDAIGGNAISTQFTASGHADLHEFIWIALNDIPGALYQDYRGVFRVLCRCKVGAATTAGLQLKWGGTTGASSANLQSATEVVVSDTNYQWLDLGECTIPIEGRTTSFFAANHVFHLFAERFSGANELYVDYLVLIPAEHMLTLDDANIYFSGGFPFYTVFDTDHDDAFVSWNQDFFGVITGLPVLSARDFFFPCYYGGRAVIVAQRATASVVTDTITVEIYSYPRWMHYRNT